MCPESTAGQPARFVAPQPSWALARFQTRPWTGVSAVVETALWRDVEVAHVPLLSGNSSGASAADLNSDGLDAEVWTALRGGRAGPGHRGGRTLDADLAMARGGSRPNPSGVSSPATESIGELARRPPGEGAVSARRGRGTARDGVRHFVRREGCGERNAGGVFDRGRRRLQCPARQDASNHSCGSVSRPVSSAHAPSLGEGCDGKPHSATSILGFEA